MPTTPDELTTLALAVEAQTTAIGNYLNQLLTLLTTTASTAIFIDALGNSVTLPSWSSIVDAVGSTVSASSVQEALLVYESSNDTAVALKAPKLSPAFTGIPTAPTASPGNNSFQLATTAFVTAADVVVLSAAETFATGAVSSVVTSLQTYATTAVAAETSRAEAVEALLAPLANPSLIGVPTTPTAAPGTNNTQISSTAFTTAAVATETTRAQNAEALLAPLSNPNLLGTPTAPTATAGANTTQIASTAFVTAADIVVLAMAEAYANGVAAGLLKFRGGVDCSSNPNYPAGAQGDAYVVTVVGLIGGSSGRSVEIGDMFFCETTNSGGTQSAVGSDWGILEHQVVGALLSANNLSDLGNAGLALINLGLNNVNNTSDMNKPVSTAQAAADAVVLSTAETFATMTVATETARAEAAESLLAPLSSPALTGTPTAPTASAGANTTQIASTAFVTAAGAVTLGSAESFATAAVAVETSRAETAEALLAPLASPALTGTPTVPTATSGTNTTQAASTAFATAADTVVLSAAETFATTAASTALSSAEGYAAGLASNYLKNLVRTAVQTGTTYNMNPSDLAVFDTTSNPINTFLPNAPADGTVCVGKMVTQGGTNTVTWHAQGSDTLNTVGGPTSGTLTVPGQSFWAIYQASTKVWTKLADDLSLAQLDARYDAIGAATTAQSTAEAFATAADAVVLAAAEAYTNSAVVGLLKFKGGLSCSSNPNYPAGTEGDAYVVTTAGLIGGGSGLTVAIGDMIVCETTNAGGTQASVGADWFILEHQVVGALLAANNLSDLTNVATARTNLGLGNLAVVSYTGTPSAGNFLRGDYGFTNTLYLAATDNYLQIQADSGYRAGFQLLGPAAAPRWNIRKGNGAETGSDAGSDFLIQRVGDTGTATSWLSVIRATGVATITGQTSISSQASVGGTAAVGVRFGLSGTTDTGTAAPIGISNTETISSAATTSYYGHSSRLSTQATTFTCPSVVDYYAAPMTLGAGSSVNARVGFYCDALVAGSNNFGFYGAVPAAVASYNLYMIGTAANYLAGPLTLGNNNVYQVGSGIYMSGTTDTGTNSPNGIYITQTISSAATAGYFGLLIGPQTAVANFTCGSVSGVRVQNAVVGAGSSITTQYGYRCDALAAGTTVYGYYGSVAAVPGVPSSVTAATIVNVSVASNVVSIITSLANNYTVGQIVGIACTTNTQLNGLATVVAAGNPFTFALTTANVSSMPDTGTVTPQTRYGLYMIGTAPNYLGGPLGLGSVVNAVTPYNFYNNLNIGGIGQTSFYANRSSGAIQSDVTAAAYMNYSGPSMVASTSSLTALYHHYINSVTIGAGSSIINQYGMYITALSGATNNYGVYSLIAKETGTPTTYAAATPTNVSVASNVVSITTSAANNFTVGQQVAVLLNTNTQLNGLVTVTGAGNPFTYSLTTANVSSTSVSGSVTPQRSWHLFMTGTASSYLGGPLGLGNNGVGNQGGLAVSFYNALVIGGAATAYANYTSATVQSTATSTAYGYATSIATQAAFFTAASVCHYSASQSTIGANSTVASQYGFNVTNTLTGATANYCYASSMAAEAGSPTSLANAAITNVAVTSNVATITCANSYTVGQIVTVACVTNTQLNGSGITIASVTSGQFTFAVVTANVSSMADTGTVTAQTRYGLYMAGTAANYLGGPLSIGSTARNAYTLHVGSNITGVGYGNGAPTTGGAVYANGVVQSDITTVATYFSTAAATQATTFSLGSLYHYSAGQGTFGAGSTVTAQYGFVVTNTLTGGASNYGFYGALTAASTSWNLYMSGTAQNYLGGPLGIGQTTPTASLHLKAGTTAAGTSPLKLTSGSLLTTPEAGAFEYLTGVLYFTDNTPTRHTIPYLDSPTFTGTPAAPTAAALAGSTQIATTAYADNGVKLFSSTSSATSISLSSSNHMQRIRCTAATTVTVTVNTGVTFDGFYCELVQEGAGQIIVTPGSGMTQNTAGTGKSRALYSPIAVEGYANATLYYVTGDMSSS